MPEFADENNPKEPLLPYYVYVLLNPLQGNRPFYVGKGTGRRVLQHALDAGKLLEEKDISNPDEHDLLSAKIQEILAIKQQGKSPLEVIVGRYETEDEAFAVEATLIHLTFGYENLTNVASGHGSRFIRSKQEFEAILAHAETQADIERKPGIDIEISRGVRDNSYRDAKVLRLAQVGAYDLLTSLRDELTANRFDWRDFQAPEDRRFHPGESNGYLATIVRIATLDLNVQFTQAKIFSIQLIHTDSSKRPESSAHLRQLSEQLHLSPGAPKAGDKYSWLEPRINYDSIRALIARLRQIRAALQGTNEAEQ